MPSLIWVILIFHWKRLNVSHAVANNWSLTCSFFVTRDKRTVRGESGKLTTKIVQQVQQLHQRNLLTIKWIKIDKITAVEQLFGTEGRLSVYHLIPQLTRRALCAKHSVIFFILISLSRIRLWKWNLKGLFASWSLKVGPLCTHFPLHCQGFVWE